MAIKLYDMEWDVGGAVDIGYPLSLHLGPMDPDYDPDVSCEVSVEGRGVGVTVVEPREGLPRKLSVPGVYICFPRRPLPSGKRVRVSWKWYPPNGREQSKQLEFTAR